LLFRAKLSRQDLLEHYVNSRSVCLWVLKDIEKLPAPVSIADKTRGGAWCIVAEEKYPDMRREFGVPEGVPCGIAILHDPFHKYMWAGWKSVEGRCNSPSEFPNGVIMISKEGSQTVTMKAKILRSVYIKPVRGFYAGIMF